MTNIDNIDNDNLYRLNDSYTKYDMIYLSEYELNTIREKCFISSEIGVFILDTDTFEIDNSGLNFCLVYEYENLKELVFHFEELKGTKSVYLFHYICHNPNNNNFLVVGKIIKNYQKYNNPTFNEYNITRRKRIIETLI